MLKKSHMAIYLLTLYLFSIMMWDYHIIYKIMMVLFVGYVLLKYRGKIYTKHNYYASMYATFIVFFAIHTMLGLSRDSSNSWKAISTLVVNLVTALCITKVLQSNSESSMMIIRGYIISALITEFYVLVTVGTNVFHGGLAETYKKLFINSYFSHNTIPMLLVFALFFLVYFYHKENRHKIVIMILEITLVSFIILAAAQKALIGVIFAVVIYPYLFLRAKNKSTLRKLMDILLVCVLLGLAIILLLKIPVLYNAVGYRVKDVLLGLVSGEFEDSSANSRSQMITIGLELIEQKPWIGWGLRAWQTWSGLIGSWAHNMFIELAVSGGILAVIIYYSFFAVTLFKLAKLQDRTELEDMYLCIMVFMIIHDLLSVSYLDRNLGFIYCLISADLIQREHRQYA